ncbi:hypothetical protein MTO96_020320 [Rhipicephalus appendiculatus]
MFMSFLVAALALFVITMALIVLILRYTPTDTSTTSTTTTTASSTTTTKAPKKLPLVGLLLCTLRSGYSSGTFVFPEDGLCAITTFNSLFVSGGNRLSPPYKQDLITFLKTAGGHRKTEYGIGIDYNSCGSETFMSALTANGTTKAYLEDMWSQRVFHFGQVNTPAIQTYGNRLQDVARSAKGLQMISQLMKRKADSQRQPSYTILHYPLLYESMAADVATALLNYPVDLLVAIGYTAYKDYLMTDCRLVPPVLYSTELLDPSALNGTYPIRLVRVISALATLAKQQRAITSKLAVSLGMAGRWYEPEHQDKLVGTPGNYSFGHHCKKTRRGDAPLRDQLSSIAEGCEDPNYNSTFSVDSTFQALFAYDKSDGGFLHLRQRLHASLQTL